VHRWQKLKKLLLLLRSSHFAMNSDSSASTPMALTPQSTGSPDSPVAKKTRRPTAFYPNVNASNKQQKPFSRSAAKRESVLALGSIEHLQHYFTKTGIAPKKQYVSFESFSFFLSFQRVYQCTDIWTSRTEGSFQPLAV
jgi:hypothetical protein